MANVGVGSSSSPLPGKVVSRQGSAAAQAARDEALERKEHYTMRLVNNTSLFLRDGSRVRALVGEEASVREPKRLYHVANCHVSEPLRGRVIPVYARLGAVTFGELGWLLQQWQPFETWFAGLLRRGGIETEQRSSALTVREEAAGGGGECDANGEVALAKGGLAVDFLIINSVSAFGSLTDPAKPPTEGMAHLEVQCVAVMPGNSASRAFFPPGLVFLRNPFVGVLVIIEADHVLYGALVGQYRLCSGYPDDAIGGTGQLTYELPAGQVGCEQDFRCVAMRELLEETGLEVKIDDSNLLTKHHMLEPSIGGTAEKGALYYAYMQTTTAKLQPMLKKTHVSGPNERTLLKLVPLGRMTQYSGDAKLLAALALLNEVRPDLMRAALLQRSDMTLSAKFWAWFGFGGPV